MSCREQQELVEVTVIERGGWARVRDGLYAAAGVVIFVALRIVDLAQTAARLQPRKRPLSQQERALLRPLFREALDYDRVAVVDGKAGLLTLSGRALTMGHTIYLPTYRESLLVHECVHVWQFRHIGFRYIGNSTFHQLDSMAFHRSYKPYDWRPRIDAGSAWCRLASVEAQAQFVQDVYDRGVFDPGDPGSPDDAAPGAFFRDGAGHNSFREGSRDYTAQANAAWAIIRA